MDRFKIIIWPDALAELKQLRAFDRKEIRESIESNLSFQPTVVSRNRKLMDQPEASFDYDPPLWELRVGTWRVFYDADLLERVVSIRAVREKPSHRTTDEIL